MSAKPYRPNVGIALFSREGLVWAGKGRSAGPEIVEPGFEWQMPQGGIEPHEDVVEAARRELAEETGARSVAFLAATDEWLPYEFPPYSGPPHRLDRWRGQTQRWVAFRFLGEESEFDLSRLNDGDPPEFSQWAWTALADLPAMATPHKRATYAIIARAFAAFAAPVA
ncbi:MAG: RNA pyrophosphohydrolase [Rhodoblastus sp.]|nr:MAG: RNA pyrophosphohydrolase [Rhodoblastus sp.]